MHPLAPLINRLFSLLDNCPICLLDVKQHPSCYGFCHPLADDSAWSAQRLI